MRSGQIRGGTPELRARKNIQCKPIGFMPVMEYVTAPSLGRTRVPYSYRGVEADRSGLEGWLVRLDSGGASQDMWLYSDMAGCQGRPTSTILRMPPSRISDHCIFSIGVSGRSCSTPRQTSPSARILVEFGRYSLYAAMLIGMTLSILRAIKVDSLDVDFFGLGSVLAALALQYGAVRLTHAIPRLIGVNPYPNVLDGIPRLLRSGHGHRRENYRPHTPWTWPFASKTSIPSCSGLASSSGASNSPSSRCTRRR